MLKTRVIPCLLLKNDGLVKGTKFRDYQYVGDPINAVKIFNDKEVDELVFLDVTATSEKKKPNFKLIADIASECFMPFGYGGGINNLDDIKKLFKLGVEKVVINSFAIDNNSFLVEAAKMFGSQSIVVAIDVKKNIFGKYEVYKHAERKTLKLDPVAYGILMQECGVGEIILTSVDREGSLKGYDLELIKLVSNAVNIPIIANGGAGTLQDFRQAALNGASGVAAGSMFVFYGKHRAVLINYPSVSELKPILNISQGMKI